MKKKEKEKKKKKKCPIFNSTSQHIT